MDMLDWLLLFSAAGIALAVMFGFFAQAGRGECHPPCPRCGSLWHTDGCIVAHE